MRDAVLEITRNVARAVNYADKLFASPLLNPFKERLLRFAVGKLDDIAGVGLRKARVDFVTQFVKLRLVVSQHADDMKN